MCEIDVRTCPEGRFNSKWLSTDGGFGDAKFWLCNEF
jgi:hypothetical protein